MVEVLFNYEGIETVIQCNINDKIEDIIEQYLIKIDKKVEKDNLLFLYNGNNIIKNLSFNKQANELDIKRKKMNVLVNKVNDNSNLSNNKIISKDIICPECKENILLDFKRFKYNLYGCKNKHNIKGIYLYKETQEIDLNKIICNICNKNNKGNSHNNLFFICNTCNKNLCPLCKSIHEQNHKIINYDDKNYICNIHNEIFIKYCETCNKDLCMLCENEHNNHKILDFKNLLIDKDDLLKINKDLNEVIENFKYKINRIKYIFDKMINILDLYYKINNDIINNYNINKRIIINYKI